MNTADIQQIMISLLKAVDNTDTVELSPGQVISLILKEIQGDMALLTYQGKDILAKLETEVPAGQRLKCMVEGEKDGQIFLKVLTGNQEGIAGETLKNILTKLGLTDDGINLRLLSEMIKQEMPLTQETARVLSTFAHALSISDQDMWVPVFMRNQGIPLTQEMYQNVKGLFTDISYLQAEMTKLLTETLHLAATTKPGSDLGQLAAEVNRALQNLQLLGNDGQETVTQKIADIFRQLMPDSSQPQGKMSELTAPKGLPGSQPGAVQPEIERNISEFQASRTDTMPSGLTQQGGKTGVTLTTAGTSQPTPAGTSQPTPAGTSQSMPDSAQPGVAKADAEQPNPPLGKEQSSVGEPPRPGRDSAKSGEVIANRLTELIDKNTVMDKATKEQVLTKINNVFEQSGKDGPQKPDLLPLLDKLSKSLSETGKQEYGELIQLTKNVMSKLEIVQNFNNKAETVRDNFIMMHSSIRFDNYEEPLRMLVNYRYDNKSKKRDFTSCRVEVKLQTPSLGLVKCEVQVNAGSLTVQFASDNEAALKLIDNAGNTLVKRLEEMKYQVTMLPSKLDLEAEKNGFLPGDKQETPGLFRINLRV
ncbi:MAG: flagellar hook-length control protein FliK [Eubacteriales bacterium]